MAKYTTIDHQIFNTHVYNKFMKYSESSYLTKKTLSDALKEEMQIKQLRKITVSEIIKKCDVNRKTFYYHFTDIYDLLKWTLEQEAIEVVKEFHLTTEYTDAMRFVMDYVEKNAHILNCAYDSIGREEMKRFFCADFYDVTSRYINELEKSLNVKVDENYKQFLIVLYTEALAGMLINAFQKKDQFDKEKTIDYLSFTITNSIPQLLINADKNSTSH